MLRSYHFRWMDKEQLHRISKALADPRRLEIFERIAAADEVACAVLVEQFPVTQATMSHHVKELVNAGLIKIRRQASSNSLYFADGQLRYQTVGAVSKQRIVADLEALGVAV